VFFGGFFIGAVSFISGRSVVIVFREANRDQFMAVRTVFEYR
jgi:hypothetical protein